MYRIYADGNLIYDNHTSELSISDATLELLQNDISTFQFTIYPSNPYINEIARMVTKIRVFRDGEIMFSGIVCDDEVGFMNQRSCKCKSDLYYLTRTIVREYEFSGSVKEYFTKLVNEHNAHSEFKFTVGNITVTDPNDYITRASSGYPTTWSEINDKCINLMGGYVSLRYADDKTYIDYLKDYETVSPQKIEFGKNLLDAKRETSGLDIATVLIPFGASQDVSSGSNDTSKHVDITSVNGGKNYIENSDGIARYGRIEKTNTWDDVHDPAILLNKAKAYLDNLIYHKMTITVSAVDLANISKIESFSMKQYIHVVSKPNGIDDFYLPMKMSINILDASQNKIELSVASQTKDSASSVRTVKLGLVDQLINAENTSNNKIDRTAEEYNSKIIQEKDSISSEITESVSNLIEKAAGTITYLDSEAIGQGTEMYVNFQKTFDNPDDYAFVTWMLVNENHEIVDTSEITFVEYVKDDNCVHIKKTNAETYAASEWHIRAFFLRINITKEEKQDV